MHSVYNKPTKFVYHCAKCPRTSRESTGCKRHQCCQARCSGAGRLVLCSVYISNALWNCALFHARLKSPPRPKQLSGPGKLGTAKPAAQVAAKPAAQPAAGEPIRVAPVEYMQLFRVKYSCKKKWDTESVELNQHPNRQFPAHFVVHTPLCLHVLFCVARPFHSNRGCEGTITWGILEYVPSGVRGNRRARALTMQGEGGGYSTTASFVRLLLHADTHSKQCTAPGIVPALHA